MTKGNATPFPKLRLSKETVRQFAAQGPTGMDNFTYSGECQPDTCTAGDCTTTLGDTCTTGTSCKVTPAPSTESTCSFFGGCGTSARCAWTC
jgi:hypothetical protein